MVRRPSCVREGHESLPAKCRASRTCRSVWAECAPCHDVNRAEEDASHEAVHDRRR